MLREPVTMTNPTATPAELAPRRRARRRTLPAPIPAAAPGAPPDPDRCTCDPARWRWQRPGNIRHEPTCPRSLRSSSTR